MAKSKKKPVEARKALTMDLDEIKKAATALRAINHKARQQILNIIHQSGEIKVSDIYAKLKIEQSLTSAFLGRLRSAKVVKTRRDGQKVYYSINYSHIAAMEKGAKLINR